jgi:hypothetical protein
MITKVHGGWLHTGLGHKKDSVYPLPRWSTYEKRNRNEPGSYNDIYHYMNFCQDNYQTAGITDEYIFFFYGRPFFGGKK